MPDVVEADHHVVSYICSSPEHRLIRPGNYYIWFCERCFFADSQDGFRGDRVRGKLDILRDKLLVENKIQEGFIYKISSEVDVSGEFISSDTALNLHLLALYIHSLLSPNLRDYSRLAKFALRIAWLYREIETLDVVQSYPPKGFATNAEFLRSLVKAWPTIPLDEKAALELAVEYYKKIYDRPAVEESERTEITMLFLLAELEYRLARYKASLGYTRRVFDTLMKRRQDIQKAMDHYLHLTRFNQQKFEEMKSLFDWLSKMFDKVSDFRKKIFGLVFEQERIGAQKVAASIDSNDPKVIYDAIVAAGFESYTAKKILSKSSHIDGGPKPQKGKTSIWNSMRNVFGKEKEE